MIETCKKKTGTAWVGKLRRFRYALATPVKGASMDRVNPFSYFELGFDLKSLENLAHGTPGDGQAEIVANAYLALERLLEKRIVDLPYSSPKGHELQSYLGQLVGGGELGGGGLNGEEIAAIKYKYERFEELLAEDLVRSAVYAVSRKGIYATEELVENGDAVVPEELRNCLPGKCRADLKQAGRCLAFDLPTASGFHLMRAVESAMYAYWDIATSKPRPTNRNWGSAIQGLATSAADENIVVILTQLKDHYRNPVIHPEITLDKNEALTLWSVATGAIILIAERLAEPGKSI